MANRFKCLKSDDQDDQYKSKKKYNKFRSSSNKNYNPPQTNNRWKNFKSNNDTPSTQKNMFHRKNNNFNKHYNRKNNNRFNKHNNNQKSIKKPNIQELGVFDLNLALTQSKEKQKHKKNIKKNKNQEKKESGRENNHLHINNTKYTVLKNKKDRTYDDDVTQEEDNITLALAMKYQYYTESEEEEEEQENE